MNQGRKESTSDAWRKESSSQFDRTAISSTLEQPQPMTQVRSFENGMAYALSQI